MERYPQHTEQRGGRTEACPDCGWPDAEIHEVVSRHPVSTGIVLYIRCVCGRLRMRSLTTDAARRVAAW